MGNDFDIECDECGHEFSFSYNDMRGSYNDMREIETGSGPDEWGTCHWFSGLIDCPQCGQILCYGDSNH